MIPKARKIYVDAFWRIKEIESKIKLLIQMVDSETTTWVLAILYRITLDVAYVFAVSASYSYAGLIYSANSMKYIVSIALYFTVFYILPKNEMDFSAFFLNMQFAIVVAPMLSYYALNNQSTIFIFMVVFCILLQAIIIKRDRSTNVNGIRLLGIKPYATAFFGIVVFVSISIPILYNGFAGFRVFDLNYLYLLREYNELPPLVPYLITWTYSAILPFGMVLSIFKKKYGRLLLCIVAQLLVYILTGAKSAYLYIVVILFIYYIATWKIMVKGLYFGLIVGCLAAALFERFTLSSNIYGLPETFAIAFFGIRLLFIPAYNKFEFYRLFHEQAFNWFSDGQLGKVFSLSTPYKESLGRIIAAFSTGRPIGINNFNTGYLGESYAQAGFIGMVCMSVLLAFIIVFLTRISKNYPLSVMVSVFSVSFIILNDMALFTTLLSSGMFVLILLVCIYQEDEASKNIRLGDPNE